MTDQPAARLVHAPWNAEQVTALNAFQHTGRMHPFTCGAEHASGQSPMLVATNGGWVCPDPQCTYRQDWAHAFMAVPVVPVSSPPPDQTALVERAAQAIRDSNGSPEALEWWRTHPQLIPAHVYADAVLAVLPPPADRTAVLLDAADGFDRHAEQILGGVGNKAVFVAKALRDQAAVWREAAETLRRLAAEAQQPDTETRP